jgi:hypothetical protein
LSVSYWIIEQATSTSCWCFSFEHVGGSFMYFLCVVFFWSTFKCWKHLKEWDDWWSTQKCHDVGEIETWWQLQLPSDNVVTTWWERSENAMITYDNHYDNVLSWSITYKSYPIVVWCSATRNV